MSVPKTILELVERFDRQRDAYRSGDYNEARLRREFLDPFFGELGWDMDNRRGYAESYKDVIHEDSIKDGAGTKAPDYCFRIGSTRKFFVEAKKPAVNIKDDISPAYQLRRYAWTAKLPVSLLTDFEEFAIYDCRVRPHLDDKASTARIRYLTYPEYIDRWEEIEAVFSREAVLKGSFAAYAEKGKGARGTTEVDDVFLEEIERWRELLARNIAERNPQITQRDLNFAVQRTIDRIVFLRICEDRGVEDYGRLKKIIDGPEVYKRLIERFHRADERYNSGLFHFRSEKDRAEAHDELTPTLAIDDKPLRDILSNLYYPTSPYEFSVLPADILGHVYERFLGKVIRLTPAHHAKIEEKPEVRKAGGVYYTPSYIVDYIIKNTLGQLLEGKSPNEAAKIRVLDPACGSGSFLLGAYQCLLDWHLDWYIKNDPETSARKKQPPVFRGKHGEWRLTSSRKKEILLNSIYGVDLDSQAIEVSKLSLLLKVLEGETEESVNAALKLFHDRALPDLGKNIRHGNSLIGPEFYESGQMRLPALEEEPMAVFDWKKAFPTIFEAGGFDVVVGNPPYLSYGGRQSVEIPDEVREYYSQRYESAGWPTAHSLFLERSIKLLSRKYVSFIVPDQVGHLGGYSSLREIAARESGIVEVRYWGEHVFRGVVTPSLTLVLDKEACGVQTTIYSKDAAEQKGELIAGQPWNFSPSAELIQRLRADSFSLGKMVGDCGIRTTAAKEQVVPLSEAKGKFVAALEGKVVNRYSCNPPEIAVRLNTKKPLFMSKEEKYRSAVYLIRQTASYPIVGPHEHVPHFRNSLLALYKPEDGPDIRYFVALLNSKLLRFVYTETVRESQQRTFPQVKVGALQTLPIHRIDLSNKQDKQVHDDLVKLVDKALEVQKRSAAEKNPIRKEALQSNFELVDNQIEQTVYKLYRATADDIRFIEASVANTTAPKEQRTKSWRPANEEGPVAGPKRTKGKVAPIRKKRVAG